MDDPSDEELQPKGLRQNSGKSFRNSQRAITEEATEKRQLPQNTCVAASRNKNTVGKIRVELEAHILDL